MLTAKELIEFEQEAEKYFAAAMIQAPVHFCGGNEEQLIETFQEVPPDAYVCSTWRSHYHALLHGVPPAKVMKEIMAGHSMNLNFPEHRFFSSAIVGGTLPIACGLAAGLDDRGGEVWCFIGDMTASIGAFHDAWKFASGHDLPITFVVEDNGLATNTPTNQTWGNAKRGSKCQKIWYTYQRKYPHVGLSQFVQF